MKIDIDPNATAEICRRKVLVRELRRIFSEDKSAHTILFKWNGNPFAVSRGFTIWEISKALNDNLLSKEL